MSKLNDSQLLRYSRQIMLPKFDLAGQEALASSRALVIGAGGLGSPVAMYLAAAGVGTLHLVDDDVVDESNLQRQIAHKETSIGQPKVHSALDTLQRINQSVTVVCHAKRLNEEEMNALISDMDVVIDCTDNFDTRFAINRACLAAKRPLVSGAAIRMEGQISVFDPRQESSPCYHCLYPDMGNEELSCSQSGVMAPLVGIIGSMQAMETIKLLADFGEPIVGKLLVLDAMSMQWRTLKIKRDKACPSCGVGLS